MLALTMGDPAGIGGELTLKAWSACAAIDDPAIPTPTIGALEEAQFADALPALPLVRISPHHGTAFDIAGQENADPSSLIDAIRLADRMGATA